MHATLPVLTAALFIAHGLVHVSLTLVPTPAASGPRTPFWPSWWRAAVDPNWPICQLGLSNARVRTLGALLWLRALAGFVAAGLGLLGIPGLRGLWPVLAASAAIVSPLMFAGYWHPWLIVGALLDVGLLAVPIWMTGSGVTH